MTNASTTGLDSARAIGDLDQVSGSIEAIFLDAGARLGEAVGCWHVIAGSFSALASQYDGDDMRRCTSGLNAALAVAGSGGTRAADGAGERLAELSGALNAMATRLGRLGKTIGEVKLVALNAKVEAAHLDAGSVDFSVFTREIDRLAADAAAELGQMDRALHSLAEQTAAAHRMQAVFRDSHGAELQAVCERLNGGIGQLSAQRQRIADAAARIGERSRLAGDHIAELISALQVGDITRQRIEHVSQALGLLSDLPSLAPTLSAADARQAAAMVLALQASQLDHTAGDLDTQLADISTNMNALSREAQELAELGRSSFAGAGGASFLDGLAAEMERTENLLQRYGEALSNTEATMRVVGQAAGAMMAHVEAVHSIEADLKIMALNASFKCARLGDKGRTLSVVAQSLRQLANRTVEDAGHLMDSLKAAMAIADTLSRDDDRAAGIGGALAELRDAATLLRANGASQDAALNALEGNGTRAREHLRAAADRMEGAAGFSVRFRAVAEHLRERAATVPVAPDRADELRRTVLANLTGNYTMASERALHQLFDDSDPGAAADEAPVDVDALLF